VISDDKFVVIFHSKTNIVKNKNKIFPNFLSTSITTSYEHQIHSGKSWRLKSNSLDFRQKYGIIPACWIEIQRSTPEGEGNLSSMVAHMLFCRGGQKAKSNVSPIVVIGD